MNFQLKRGMKEGDDFMLVDENLHKFWVGQYGEVQALKRLGIVDENGESVVEVYWKQINILPIPNQKVFKLFKGKDAESQPIFISKTATIEDLTKKVQRVLMAYLYYKLKNKSLTFTQLRLWRSNDELKKLGELDKKYTNFTQVKIDAEILNITADQKKKMLHEVDMADSDIIIVELPKDGDFVF